MDTQEESLKRGEVPGSPAWGHDPRTGTLVKAKDGGVETRQVPNIPGNYLAYYEAIRDAIALGAPNPVPPEESLAVIKLLEAGIRSSVAHAELPYNQASNRSSAI
jgi:predicted dehydrogenase